MEEGFYVQLWGDGVWAPRFFDHADEAHAFFWKSMKTRRVQGGRLYQVILHETS